MNDLFSNQGGNIFRIWSNFVHIVLSHYNVWVFAQFLHIFSTFSKHFRDYFGGIMCPISGYLRMSPFNWQIFFLARDCIVLEYNVNFVRTCGHSRLIFSVSASKSF